MSAFLSFFTIQKQETMIRYLKYVGTPLSDSEKDFEDVFIQRIQSAVKEVKASREMGARYMTFQELLNDEREAGRKEGRAEGLKEGRTQMIFESLERLGNISDELRQRIDRETDLEILRKWCKLAIGVDTIAQFEREMES